MRRVLIKYDDSVNQYLSLLNRYCIREISSNKNNCLILILTDDGYTICKNMIPSYIIKSVKVDLFDILVYSSSGRECREIINKLPYSETFIYGNKIETMLNENYSIRFKGFFSDSEFEKLSNISDSLLVFKNRNLVKLKCLTPIKNLTNLQVKLSNDLKNNIYDIFDFESDNYVKFTICVDVNKIDVLNKLDYLKILNISIFNNYNLNF